MCFNRRDTLSFRRKTPGRKFDRRLTELFVSCTNSVRKTQPYCDTVLGRMAIRRCVCEHHVYNCLILASHSCARDVFPAGA